MAGLTFFAGTLFGAVVLSTIPTTGRLIAEISPYVKQGFDFTMRFIMYLGANL